MFFLNSTQRFHIRVLIYSVFQYFSLKKEEKVAREDNDGKFFTLGLALVAILFFYYALKQSIQSDLPRLTRLGTEETTMLSSFPTFFPEGEYVCYPTIGKHIFFQSITQEKKVCQRGEIILVEEDYLTYIWYR